MITIRCMNYVGVTCVNGSCPNALANEYPEYGYEHCGCKECGYYKGVLIVRYMEQICAHQLTRKEKLWKLKILILNM